LKAIFNLARTKSKPAVTEQLDTETQALTKSAKELKALSTHRREMALLTSLEKGGDVSTDTD
jgi:hypothetical protein